ncbi:MAG: histidine ammonia-lyase [Thermoleophilia bacterium]
MTVQLDGRCLTLDELIRVARGGEEATLAAQSYPRMEASRRLIEETLAGGKPVYGVNTGFGKFSDVAIAAADVVKLQRNLVLSCCVGVGTPLPSEVVRAMMLLRANSLAAGDSGVRPVLVEHLVELLNRGVHPVVPSQGSVGASGDLAPLAHLSLVLMGRGHAAVDGEIVTGGEALRRAALEPLELQAKEGLSLCNGTQAMTALTALAVHDAARLADSADVVAALSAEALRAVAAAFDERLHRSRPHAGQIASAANLRRLLGDSPIVAAAAGERVQDAYALRCLPQVHGASRDAIAYVRGVVETEMNSVTDNPLVYPREGDVLSGGNFHGQPLALAADFLGIAVAELANISERRTERLLNPALNLGLPAFLTSEGGLNDGFMVAQYTAAALVSENKVLAHPASVDSIPTSANQEDHVSMGSIGARHAREIVANATRVLAVELLCASQAMDLRGLVPGARTAAAKALLRARVPMLVEDRELDSDIELAADLIRSGALLAVLQD